MKEELSPIPALASKMLDLIYKGNDSDFQLPSQPTGQRLHHWIEVVT
jgi:hypothetical protein